MRTKTKGLLPPDKADILPRRCSGRDVSGKADCASKWGAMLNTQDFRALSEAVVLNLMSQCPRASWDNPQHTYGIPWDQGTIEGHYSAYDKELAKNCAANLNTPRSRLTTF